MDLNKEEKMLRIRFERLIRNWRQEDLAHFARVSVADVSKIESGRMNPFPAHARRLAEALNLAPEQLTEKTRLGRKAPPSLRYRSPEECTTSNNSQYERRPR